MGKSDGNTTPYFKWCLAKIGVINPFISRQLRIKHYLFRKPQVARNSIMPPLMWSGSWRNG